MLKGISPLISPQLLKILSEMGHGDDLAIVDANFPAASCTRMLERLDGVSATAALEAVLTLLPVDDFGEHPVRSMAVVGDEEQVPPVVKEFNRLIRYVDGQIMTCHPLAREEFYDQARAAYAIVATGEARLYGNILIRKGVIKAYGPDTLSFWDDGL